MYLIQINFIIITYSLASGYKSWYTPKVKYMAKNEATFMHLCSQFPYSTTGTTERSGAWPFDVPLGKGVNITNAFIFLLRVFPTNIVWFSMGIQPKTSCTVFAVAITVLRQLTCNEEKLKGESKFALIEIIHNWVSEPLTLWARQWTIFKLFRSFHILSDSRTT